MKQSELEAQYQIELATLRDRARDKDGAAIREQFLEQIRRWYIDHREQNGKFPDLPPEDEGGSKMIYSMPDGPSESPVPAVVKKVCGLGSFHFFVPLIFNRPNLTTNVFCAVC